MGTFLTESVPVSISGTLGNTSKYKLYACDQPNVILYVAKQPVLMLDSNGKPAVAVTTYTAQQPDHSVKIIGGAATIGLNTAPQLDAASIDEAKAIVASLGVGNPNQLKFLPLTTQKGLARLNLPTAAGTPDEAHNKRDVGTPGGLLSFLANLSEMGALEWSNAIKNRSKVNGDITIQYDYLRRVPDIGAEVRVHGDRVFTHLSAALDVSYNGFLYGGSAKIEAAWDELSRNGGVEIVFLNQGLPPELENLRQEFVKTFAKQAMQILFDQIFAPMPQVAPAQAGDSGGIFGGANFALKWKKQSDSINMTQRIEFRGTTWLTDTMDVSLAALFANLDPSCLTEVPAQQAFDAVVLVDPDPMLSNAAISVTYSEGRSPDAPLFTKDGGNQRYTVVSTQPNNVNITAKAKISYTPPRWPIINYDTANTVANGGNQVVIKSSAWVGRQMIYRFVRDGNRILPPNELTPDDYLVLNVSYEGPHLPSIVRDSATISGLAPVEFAYPLDPQGRPGVAKFNAFGVIGGRLVNAPDQVIPQQDSAVFILATRGGKIELFTSLSMIGESDNLARDLVRSQARPRHSGTGTSEMVRPGNGIVVEGTRPGYGNGNGNGAGKIISGRTAGVEYSMQGTSLWIRLSDGTSKRVRLLNREDSEPFADESKSVKVQLDGSGEYAENIFLMVS